MTQSQSSKIPRWPNIIWKSLPRMLTCHFSLKSEEHMNRLIGSNINQTFKVCTNFHKMEHKNTFFLMVVFFPSPFIHCCVKVKKWWHLVSTKFCNKIFLRGLLLLFLGAEDLRRSGPSNSTSSNRTTSPSSLMSGTFHLHSSDNFDAYLSEVAQFCVGAL